MCQEYGQHFFTLSLILLHKCSKNGLLLAWEHSQSPLVSLLVKHGGAFISIDCYNTLLSVLPKRNISNLQLLQNFMCCSGPEGRNSGLKICPFYYLYNFKCSNHLRPSYLSDLFSEYQPSWTLGCSSSLLLVIPNVRTKPHSEASFSLLLPAACQRASGLRLFLL